MKRIRRSSGWLLGAVLVGVTVVSVARADQERVPAKGLHLEARVEKAQVVSGRAITFTATLRNQGGPAAEIYLPLHIGSRVFPRWSFVDANGNTWRPYDAPFQSMWPQGMHGSILRLGPKEARTFTTERTHFVRRDAGATAGEDAGVPLPPGTYRVAVEYVQEDDLVPYSVEGREFRTEKRRHEGLWTGRLRSGFQMLEVVPSDRPVLRLEGPESAPMGRPFPLRVSVANPTASRRQIRGAFVVTIGSKAYGSGALRYVLRSRDGLVEPRPDAFHDFTLEAGGSRTFELDLDAVSFQRSQRAHARRDAVGLADVVGEGMFHLGVALHEKGRDAPLVHQGAWRRLEGPEPGPVAGLELVLVGASSGGVAPSVRVVLRNAGSEPVRVPASLSYPRHVFFALRRPGASGEGAHYSVTHDASGGVVRLMNPDEPGIRAKIQDGLSWDGGRFERTRVQEDASVAVLPPGGELRRVFDLGELVSGSDVLSHGVFEVRAFWRNRDSGRRLGLKPSLATGLLASDPIEVRGRGW